MASLFTNPNVRVGVRSGLPEPRAAAQHGAKQHRFDPYTMNGGYDLIRTIFFPSFFAAANADLGNYLMLLYLIHSLRRTPL